MSAETVASAEELKLPQLHVASGDDLATILFRAQGALAVHPYAVVVSIPHLADADETLVREQVSDALAATYPVLSHGVSGQLLQTWPIGVNRQPEWASPHNNIAGQSTAAMLHTDAPTIDNPDRYVAMLCMKPCSHGGGDSLLMPIDGIAAALSADDLATLVRDPAPFATDVFSSDGSYTYTLCPQPVLFDQATRVRFRHEMLCEGAALSPPEPPLTNALARLTDIICGEMTPIARHRLCPGQMLLLDNTKCLHGRTAFSDTARYLMRWRLGPVACCDH